MAKHGHNHVVSVLDCDPDLGAGLSGEQLAAARNDAVARCRCYPRGNWGAVGDPDDTSMSLGLLVLSGFVVRGLTVAEYTCSELLGPGDLVQPWAEPSADHPVPIELEWTVVQRLRVAVLDGAFSRRVTAWPEITAALSRRLSCRTHWLAFQLALSALRRIDDRVMLMLWQFAHRWGTVTREGVMLDVPLTHELFASVIGARRPSVSAAVGRLVEREQIRPRPRSRWLLLAAPPLAFDAEPNQR